MRKRIIEVITVIAMWIVASVVMPLSAQTEVMAWGNMTGVRVDGELIQFESSLRVAADGWLFIEATGKERQRPSFHRDGNTQTVTTQINKLYFKQVVTDMQRGLVQVDITTKSDTTLMAAEGVFFCMELPDNRYVDGIVKIGGTQVNIAQLKEGASSKKSKVKEITITTQSRLIKLAFASGVSAFVRKEAGSAATLYVQLLPSIEKGKEVTTSFKLHADGVIDHSDAVIHLDVNNPGRLFAGFGGNFRLQNPGQDPKVIDYCLANLRVAFGRVEFPWRNWQKEENTDPIAEANAGKLDGKVRDAVLMAQRLKAKGLPLIISCWFPPTWAIAGDPKSYRRNGGIQAYKLDPDKQEKIYKSLSDYLVFIKQKYGIEAQLFSFNESDIGIDVLFSPQEHAAFIKGFGAYMAKRGLATKMLLGDNSDATTFDFIVPAMKDPATYPYIGAVSFHSWRGCDDMTLHKWAGASRALNVPLIIGEGSTDAAAHTYAEIFNESTFALYEINLYTRICAICQPLSILQWQLTSDYSLLWGDGIYGSQGPLRPTQRFWNMKQLASTPEEAFSIPVTCSKKEVNCAAFGNIAQEKYAVHMINNGAKCQAVITGIPEGISDLQIYVTNSVDGMKENGMAKVENGRVTISLPAISFVTLLSK
ncbi:MAG TPA: hypothetical protein VIK42_00495 [Bacteroidales bacterium]